MFKAMLEAMEAQTAATLSPVPNARALWYNEWAKLLLRAYGADETVGYTSAYAFPLEILAAFDVVPFDFELTAGLIDTTPAGVTTMAEAEGRSCSPDICSFHRTALGASFAGYFPKPDLLLTTSYYYDGKPKTNEILSHIHQKEAILLYIPAEVTLDSVRYLETQLRKIASRIAEVAGCALDEERLKEAVRSSNRARLSHLGLLDLLKNRPAPWRGKPAHIVLHKRLALHRPQDQRGAPRRSDSRAAREDPVGKPPAGGASPVLACAAAHVSFRNLRPTQGAGCEPAHVRDVSGLLGGNGRGPTLRGSGA